jgi:hypothetical protein
MSNRYDVVQGGSVTMSIEADGTLPMGYRWRKASTTLKSEVLDSYVSFMRLDDVQPADGGNTSYTVVLTNAAFSTPGRLSAPIRLTVLADSELDGMPPAPASGDGGLEGLVGMSMAQIEREVIRHTLKANEGNRERTSKVLGIGERTLYRKLKEYGLS